MSLLEIHHALTPQNVWTILGWLWPNLVWTVGYFVWHAWITRTFDWSLWPLLALSSTLAAVYTFAVDRGMPFDSSPEHTLEATIVVIATVLTIRRHRKQRAG